MQDTMSHRMPDKVSEYMSDRRPDRKPEFMSDRMPDFMPDRMSKYISDKLSEYIEYIYKYTSFLKATTANPAIIRHPTLLFSSSC